MQEIYEEYSNLVYNYLVSLTGNLEISQELMQETFYSAIKNIKKFKGDSSVKTWLLKIAKNKWKDYLKTSKSTQLYSLDEDTDKIEKLLLEPSFENDLLEKEKRMFLYKSIHKLDENTKEVIYLRLNSNFSFKEIGNIFGKSEDWAKVTFYRGKQKLKEEYKNEEF